MCQTPDYSIELLAPARDKEVARQAILHGADAVYMGATSHGARAAATNSLADIAETVRFAHQYRARVYVTVNTLVYDSELKEVERLIRDLYRIGVDALIVQDLGILRLDIPPIALHASTQCDIRTPEKARFLQELGFSQLVLPRELSLTEIKAMREATTVPLEAFVHGALCVSYSGACYASLFQTGRSANRGECAQLCRVPYTLTDGNGRTLMRDKHLLSLRDLNRLPDLQALIQAGVSSLKIEGRLKDAAYVKNVVSAYDRRLRELGVKRTSLGEAAISFNPDVARSFNRGFTSYFLRPEKAGQMAGIHTPKSLGIEIGRVKAVGRNFIELKGAKEPIVNGDGLFFIADDGRCGGFRANRVDPQGRIFLSGEIPEGLKPGMAVMRNFDKAFNDRLDGDTARRTIELRLRLRRTGSQIVLEVPGAEAATIEAPNPQKAKSPQLEARLRAISKLGGTPYRLEELNDELADEFVAASIITELRRRLVELLMLSNETTYPFDRRLPEKPEAKAHVQSMTWHDNVANRLAEQLLRDHGVTTPIEPAAEVKLPKADDETVVMTTRYCLRRELGHCLRTPAGNEWPEPLTLHAAGFTLHPRFDCKNCQMQILR